MSYPSDLFRAIFTPGAPPALLLATNVSFALLQATLLVMLLTTYSIHFIFLSVICGGVWGGINWFVRELALLEKIEKRAEEIRGIEREMEKEKGVDEEDEEEEGVSTGVDAVGLGRIQVGETDEESDFEKVEMEEGYETEGKKSK